MYKVELLNMPLQRIMYFLVLIVTLNCCSKNHDKSIDVSQKWKIDNLGLVIAGLDDGQWQSKIYTQDELNLFTSNFISGYFVN